MFVRTAFVAGVSRTELYKLIMSWTEDQCLELIALYRDRPVLWDFSHPEHYKKNVKSDVWEDIARLLNRDVESLPNKMINLLASYRRERTKIRGNKVVNAKGNFSF